MLEQKLSD